ncbi:hypothetical protein M404DRAFT_27515 [Pisolithus tinctorius Marx 270]|uniref:DUF4939 domain-containing protein n=1 Tax=Pisolithus tinctorius Marx 270 TaxID=870435 RepID=A0A0C3JZW6_PISTI|nr:hypothetical protein M404DRAFT_27515 [Pisolithus tinctorius Marx 270]
MATKTHFQPPHGHSATNPDSASASGTGHKTALAALGTTRYSPDPNDPSNDGLGDNDNNNPDDDDPSNGPGNDGPSDDNPDENDLEDKPDFPDPDTKPMVAVFDSLAKAIKLLAHNTHTGPETDHAKVIFAQSYLKGMALEWFKPDLLRLNDPDDWPLWMDSWREFVLELQTTFGPHNPVTDTKSQLNHLHMKDNQCINKLPDQIKDKVCQVGKPQTLHELCHLAQEIDACYLECKEEVQWASKHQGLSTSSNNKSRGSSNC